MKTYRLLLLCLSVISTQCIGDPAYKCEVQNDLSSDVVMTIEGFSNILIPAHGKVKIDGRVMLYRGPYSYDLRDRRGNLIGREIYVPEEIEGFHHGDTVIFILDDRHFHAAVSPSQRLDGAK